MFFIQEFNSIFARRKSGVKSRKPLMAVKASELVDFRNRLVLYQKIIEWRGG
jgi:hypothetical protein